MLFRHLGDIVTGDALLYSGAHFSFRKSMRANMWIIFLPLDIPDFAARVIDSAVFTSIMQALCPARHPSPALVDSLSDAPHAKFYTSKGSFLSHTILPLPLNH